MKTDNNILRFSFLNQLEKQKLSFEYEPKSSTLKFMKNW